MMNNRKHIPCRHCPSALHKIQRLQLVRTGALSKHSCWLLVLFLLLNTCGCCDDAGHLRQLSQADSLLRSGSAEAACVLLDSLESNLPSLRRSTRMRFRLLQADAMNKTYRDFTTDSIMLEVADYYDRHGTSNERLRARYLLGCTYRDMHEAPLALITWEDAIACADTTAEDCDYATLFRVYGQMADVYRRQHLTEKQLNAEIAVSQYAKCANDIYNYIRGIELQAAAYYDMGDSAGIFQTTERARKLYLEHGMKPEAAQVYAAAIHFLVNHKHFEEARALMKVYEDESGLFSEQGEIIPTREQYYYYKGMYFLGTGRLDSAEIQFRRLLTVKEDIHDAYLCLFSLYQQRNMSDSALHYAHLYQEALLDYLKDTKIDAVTQAVSMYDFHRHERLAQKERQRTKRARFMLAGVLIISLITAFVTAFFYRMKKKAGRQRYLLLYKSLRQAKDNLTKTQGELDYLRRNLPQKEQTEALLREKEKKIQDLEAEVRNYQAQLGYMETKKDEASLMNCEIVIRLREIARVRTEKDAEGHLQVTEPRICTDDEWDDLSSAIRQYHHNLYVYVTDKHHLPKLQLKVCFLSRLRFETQEMGILLGRSSQTISNARNKIAKRLFDLNDLSLLNERLAAL